MFEDDFLNSQNINFIIGLYKQYLQDKNSVDDEWRKFFAGYSGENLQEIAREISGPQWPSASGQMHNSALSDSSSSGQASSSPSSQLGYISAVIENLVKSYIRYGHLAANTDPLGIAKGIIHSEITEAEKLASSFNEFKNINYSSRYGNNLAEVVNNLKSIYSDRIGVEFDQLNVQEEKDWTEKQMIALAKQNLDSDIKKSIYSQLDKAEFFEQYLHKKFMGAKRFSLEGGESYMVAMESVLSYLAESGGRYAIIGMAHRGRLNSLVHICDKPLHKLFYEFQGKTLMPDAMGSGDVKYHMGQKALRTFNKNKMMVEILPNPSHLEAINSVVLGKARRLQDEFRRTNKSTAIEYQNSSVPILVHGDASFIGQGSVAETFSMAYLPAYTTGGTIHVVINNQVGFTADAKSTRSSLYSSDFGKVIGALTFHVNGDDPEACYKAAKIAAAYRNKFHKDVIIEIVCYRKYGHNESDEPTYTQPLMYEIIKNKKTVFELYKEYLLAENITSLKECEALRGKMIKQYEVEAINAESYLATRENFIESTGYEDGNENNLPQNSSELPGISDLSSELTIKIGMDIENFDKIAAAITEASEGFDVNIKLKKQLEKRKKDYLEGNEIDWAMAEMMAFAWIMKKGIGVRMSGQDVERGTFSQRHAVLSNSHTGDKYNLLEGLTKVFKNDSYNSTSEFYNSLLSETAVLGFEYGYSVNKASTFTLWEAQFGDFANGAMVIYDQFIASGRDKWGMISNMATLLPHGYEGQGPEHSSGRLERFLQSCANDNIIVANCTTPANYFHLLCRQGIMVKNSPLIVMTPKSLLRMRQAISRKEEFTEGWFRPVIANIEKLSAKAKTVIITSGKVYYDLKEALSKNDNKIAIIRLEQYYPFPQKNLEKALMEHSSAQNIIWLQEESYNMGAWHFVRPHLEKVIASAKIKPNVKTLDKLNSNLAIRCQNYGGIFYIGRNESSSPAVASHSRHQQEQELLIKICLKISAL